MFQLSEELEEYSECQALVQHGFGLYFGVPPGGSDDLPELTLQLRKLSGTMLRRQSLYDPHQLSEIIPGGFYLTSLEGCIEALSNERISNESLLISYLSIEELGQEPRIKKHPQIRMHWLASELEAAAYIQPDRLRETLTMMTQHYDLGKPIVLHCKSGISRSPALAYAFIMHLVKTGHKLDGLSWDPEEGDLQSLCFRSYEWLLEKRDCIRFDSARARMILGALMGKPKLSDAWSRVFKSIVEHPEFRQLAEDSRNHGKLKNLLLHGPRSDWADSLTGDAVARLKAFVNRLVGDQETSSLSP